MIASSSSSSNILDSTPTDDPVLAILKLYKSTAQYKKVSEGVLDHRNFEHNIKSSLDTQLTNMGPNDLQARDSAQSILVVLLVTHPYPIHEPISRPVYNRVTVLQYGR